MIVVLVPLFRQIIIQSGTIIETEREREREGREGELLITC